MEQFPETIECIETKQEYAKVITTAGHCYSVATDTGIFQVKRAVSCLVEPCVDDLVLVTTGGAENGYILAVLERESTNTTTILFAGDVDIKSEKGRIGITAQNGMYLASAKEISLTSPELDLTAARSTVAIGNLTFLGTVIEAQLDRIKTIIDHVDSFVKRFFQKAGQSYRLVEDLDYVKSDRISYEAGKTLQLRGAFTQMTAKEDIHIDGKRINIG